MKSMQTAYDDAIDKRNMKEEIIVKAKDGDVSNTASTTGKRKSGNFFEFFTGGEEEAAEKKAKANDKSALVIQRSLLTGLVVGNFPLDTISNNEGMQIIIEGLTGSMPSGLSASTVTRRVDLMYTDEVEKRKKTLLQIVNSDVVPGTKSENVDEVIVRKLSISQDAWSARFTKDTFLGCTCTFINTEHDKSWELQRTVLSLIPFEGSHSACNGKEKLDESLKLMGLSVKKNIFACTQDTTGSSLWQKLWKMKLL
jgi:hypothetical protein